MNDFKETCLPGAVSGLLIGGLWQFVRQKNIQAFVQLDSFERRQ
jgi:hypothetical protein